MGTGRGGGERTHLSLRPKGAEATPELGTEGRKGRKGGSTAGTLFRSPPSRLPPQPSAARLFVEPSAPSGERPSDAAGAPAPAPRSPPRSASPVSLSDLLCFCSGCPARAPTLSARSRRRGRGSGARGRSHAAEVRGEMLRPPGPLTGETDSSGGGSGVSE